MFLNASTESKIDEFRSIIFIKYYILQFDISMCDLFIVKIIQCGS
jgi:hypothetical protein